jgi:ParB-like nuclease domain
MAFIHTELVDPSQLRLYPGNPRRGELEAIKDSLRRHGQYRPIVANRRTGEVLAGNHVLLAARELGLKELAVAFIDVDDEHAKRIVAVDNRTSDLAGYDPESLAALLSSLPDLAGTGYGDADLSKLLDELAPRRKPRSRRPSREEPRPARASSSPSASTACSAAMPARPRTSARSALGRPSCS